VSRRRVLTALRVLLAVLVTAAVVLAVAKNWTEVSADLRRMSPGTVVLAALVGCLPPMLTVLAWRRLLADLGSPIHLAPAGGIFFVGQLGKYVPGSVWAIVAQAEMATRLHVPRRRTAVTGLLNVGLAAVCGFIVGIPSLRLLVSGGESSATGWVLLLLVPLLVLVLWPPLLNWAIALGLRVLRREPLEHRLSGRAVLFTVVAFCASWLCSGVSVYLLARAVAGPDTDEGRLVLATVSGFALAAATSMFTVVLPAGVGLREGLLVLQLGPVNSLPQAAPVEVVAGWQT
jgi:hypothetical protein